MSVTPDKHHNRDALEFTGIPMRFYENILTQTFPEEWNFWQADPPIVLLEDGASPPRSQYVGAVQDNKHIGASPFKDVIEWDRVAAHIIVYCPTHFASFYVILGFHTHNLLIY
jgi:hypothetical protein